MCDCNLVVPLEKSISEFSGPNNRDLEQLSTKLCSIAIAIVYSAIKIALAVVGLEGFLAGVQTAVEEVADSKGVENIALSDTICKKITSYSQKEGVIKACTYSKYVQDGFYCVARRKSKIEDCIKAYAAQCVTEFIDESKSGIDTCNKKDMATILQLEAKIKLGTASPIEKSSHTNLVKARANCATPWLKRTNYATNIYKKPWLMQSDFDDVLEAVSTDIKQLDLEIFGSYVEETDAALAASKQKYTDILDSISKMDVHFCLLDSKVNAHDNIIQEYREQLAKINENLSKVMSTMFDNGM